MRVWIDDIRKAPIGWVHIHSVNEFIERWDELSGNIEAISLDHDSGDYYKFGGDYIKVLDFMEWKCHENEESWDWDIRYRLHSANPCGVEHMRNILRKNGWIEFHELKELPS